MPEVSSAVDALSALKAIDAQLRASLQTRAVPVTELPGDVRDLLATTKLARPTLSAEEWSLIYDRLESACVHVERTVPKPVTGSPIARLIALMGAAAPARAAGPQTHAFAGGGLEARLTVLDDGSVVAQVEGRWGRKARGTMVEVDGSLQGHVTLGGHTLELDLNRRSLELKVSGDRSETLSLSSGTRKELGQLCHGVRNDALERRLAELSADPRLTAAQKQAAAAIRGLEEGTYGYTFAFLRHIAEHDELTPADAAAAPLLFAWATTLSTSAAPDVERLRANVTHLRDTLDGNARAILDAALAQGSPAAGAAAAYNSLTAGLFGARAAILEPGIPLAIARARGWEKVLSLFRQPEKRSAEFVGLWRQLLAEVGDVLPAGAAARTRLESGLTPTFAATARGAEEAVTHMALALGEAMYVMRTAAPPPHRRDSGETLPLLDLSSAICGVRVDVLEGKLGADQPSWRDVNQGAVGDCYFVSPWIGIAASCPETLKKVLTPIEIIDADGQKRAAVRATVYLPDSDGTLLPFQQTVDSRVYVDDAGAPLYGKARDGGAPPSGHTWFPMVEKVFAHVRRMSASYGSINHGHADEVLKMVFGKAANTWEIGGYSVDELAKRLVSGLEDQRLVTVVEIGSSWQALASSPLFSHHVYALLGVEKQDGVWVAKLVNPHSERSKARPSLYSDVYYGACATEEEQSYRNKPGGELRVPLAELIRHAQSIKWIDPS